MDKQTLEGMVKEMQSSAGAGSVFGEPVTAGERTVIPVARLMYGFGGGTGHGESEEGSGGGGGIAARPVGVVEISPSGTRFISSGSGLRYLAVLGLGILAGIRIGRRLGGRY